MPKPNLQPINNTKFSPDIGFALPISSKGRLSLWISKKGNHMKYFGLALSSALFAACSGQKAGVAENSESLSVNKKNSGVFSLVDCKLSEKELKDYYNDDSMAIKGDQDVKVSIKIESNGSKTLSGTIKTPDWSLAGKSHPATVAIFKSLPISKIEFSTHRHLGNRADLSISGEMSIVSKGKSRVVKLNDFVLLGSSGSDDFGIQFSKDLQGDNLGIATLLHDSGSPTGKCNYRNMDLLKKLASK